MIVLGDPVWKKNERLAAQLLDLTGRPPELDADCRRQAAKPGENFLQNADAVVTHTEVNDRHGVGVLLRRLFRGRRNILTVRSSDHYDGQQDFEGVGLLVSHEDTSRDATFRTLLNAVKGHNIARILCMPYYPDDARNALALKEVFGVPLCTYLLDDQNICAPGIPDDLMRELLVQSSLRLAVSPEMVVAYGFKYSLRVGYLPPVATAKYVLDKVHVPESLTSNRFTGVIVGNIWGHRWLDLLRTTVRESGVTLRWHAVDPLRFLEANPNELAHDRIVLHDGPYLSEDELVGMLRQAPFTVIPSGDLKSSSDDRSFIAQLSLPSRIPFMLATSGVPMILLGSNRTPAARFVENHRIGTVCDYDDQKFRTAVEWITTPDINRSLRENAAAIAGRFSDESALDWIWQSLDVGKPLDTRYAELMPAETPDVAHLIRQT